MDDGLKQRLIGALVLLALAVIFVPVIFDRERIEPVDKRTQIPAAPHIEPVDETLFSPSPKPLPSVTAETMYIPDDNNVADLRPEKPALDSQGVPKSWVLQVASFRFEKSAEDVRDKLIEAGYASYIETVETDSGRLRRVFVGPKIDKNILIEQKRTIKETYGFDALLLKFEP